MKNLFLSKVLILSLLTSALVLLNGCSSEPVVSRYMTVETYNATQEAACEMVSQMGYQPKGYRASTYYKYVLFDGHKKCPEGGEFCTGSHSCDHISPSDRCIKCGQTWDDHENFNY